MILLDASALLGLLLAEPAQAEVEALLREGGSAVTATGLAEVVDRLIRRRGIPPREVRERLGPLTDHALGVVAIDEPTGWRAGELRAAHYARAEADLSLADCVLLACATGEDSIATSDGALAAAAAAENLEVIPLPASDGRRPSAVD